MEFFSIGVYKSNEIAFLKKLTDNLIDTFCDIRQRRGVRGSEYVFVNSNRLQFKLNELEIKYIYIPELAPTTEIRELQKSADSQSGENKRDRSKLGKVFTITYKEKILKKFDFKGYIEKLEQIGSNKIVFFLC